MDLGQSADAYCERLDPSLWAEPLNAASNIAFLLAVAILWRRTGQGSPLTRALTLQLALIGVASALWHTMALGWAGALDSASIAVFVLIYLFAANRHYLGWSGLASALGMLAFLPYTAVLGWAFSRLPFLATSAGYWPLPVLIAAYALILRHRAPATASGLALGAGLLALSITIRSGDMPLCAVWPVGTHFLWHILNATLLAWMIVVLHRHTLAAARTGR